MTIKQGFLATAVVFSSVCFSPGVNISLQHLIYQVILLNLKNCFHIASALFLLSINYNFIRTQANFDTVTSLGSK